MANFGAPDDLDTYLRPILLKDFRTQCRARGLSPAGTREALCDRLKDAMIQTGDFTFKNADGSVDVVLTETAFKNADPVMFHEKNNYHRPEGQNVGNFLTDRNTSRVLAPPGGSSQVCFGGTDQKPPAPPQQMAPQQMAPQQVTAQPQTVAPSNASPAAHGLADPKNNYQRPGGMQNVGNFITDRNSSRVLAPPGGQSNVTFG